MSTARRKRFKNISAPRSATTIIIWVIGGAALAAVGAPVDYQRDIQPIFAEHCLQCHGPDEGARQAGIRFDVRDSALAEAESGATPIVPGSPGDSELLRRVSSADADVVMPPPDQNNPLNSRQIELLKRWLTEGAPYTDHWAFVAPQRPDVPQVDTKPEQQVPPATRHPIDAFILDRLADERLSMSVTAPRDVLCRRIYLDLIGLPPSPHQVIQFVDDAARDLAAAVNSLLDELLESEHFGEKWARHWMDVARYADTNGYEKDEPREQWAWRDWVIRAINADMPYDQFLVEQIAGDLLPGRTQDTLVATGFLRNGLVNEEGAVLPEQFRMEGMFDRMDCIGKAVLGLSIQCAQCHSHKFDPIAQHEYYGMLAMLNNTCEARSWVYTPEQQKKIADIHGALRAIQTGHKPADNSQVGDSSHPNAAADLTAWEIQQTESTPRWEILDTTEQIWVGGVNHPDELPDHSVLVLGQPSAEGEMYVVAEPVFDGVTGMRLEALTHGDLPFGGPGRNVKATFAITELTVQVRAPDSDQWEDLPLRNATTDFSEPEQVLSGEEDKKEEEKRRAGPISFLIDGNETTGWRADRGPVIRHTASVVVVQFHDPVIRPEGTRLKVSLAYKHSPPGGLSQSTMVGRTRFAITRTPYPRAAAYNHAATLAMEKTATARNAADQAAIFRAWVQSVPQLNHVFDDIVALEKKYPEALTSVLTLTARPPEEPRQTNLLARGVWDKPVRPIQPHVPAVLHPISAKNPDRLAFARWLADPRSPLTARVHVNRVWQAMFGAGLVESPEDFGIRAAQPEYHRLLDWLAVELMDRGWSTKHLIRTIVTSRAYQQSSRATPMSLERDPQNRLIARGPRFRVEAEVVRDIALSVSGLLSPKTGGPSVYPPVPESVLAYNFGRPKYWVVAEDADRYRRAIYLFRKRSMPDPVLSSFDSPNADTACARRERSNTPLASLTSLNETIFVEAARALALRVLREGGSTDEQRADYGFQLCTSRPATAAERDELLELISTQRQRLAEGWLSINEVATGDPDQQPDLPPDTIPQDVATWTIAARVLLNLDETMSKN